MVEIGPDVKQPLVQRQRGLDRREEAGEVGENGGGRGEGEWTRSLG